MLYMCHPYAILQVLDMIDPLLRAHPRRVMSSIVHTWEKALLDGDGGVDGEASPIHTHLIDILNQMRCATPDVIIASLVPIAVQVMEATSTKGRTRVSDAMHDTILPLRIDETAVLHLLDRYMSHCVLTDQLATAWPSLQSLCRDANTHSSHEFTFLWVLSLLQQFIRRCRTLDKRVQKEVQTVVIQIVQTVALMAGQTQEFVLKEVRRACHVICTPVQVLIRMQHTDTNMRGDMTVHV